MASNPISSGSVELKPVSMSVLGVSRDLMQSSQLRMWAESEGPPT